VAPAEDASEVERATGLDGRWVAFTLLARADLDGDRMAQAHFERMEDER
jgi:hypothetical protein